MYHEEQMNAADLLDAVTEHRFGWGKIMNAVLYHDKTTARKAYRAALRATKGTVQEQDVVAAGRVFGVA